MVELAGENGKTNGSAWRPSPEYPVPSYLPDRAKGALVLAKSLVNKALRKYHVNQYDLWEEAIQALLRADLGFDEEKSSCRFTTYARTSVYRALWIYVLRSHVARLKHGVRLHSWDTGCGDGDSGPRLEEVRVSSPEELLLAREAALERMAAIPERKVG